MADVCGESISSTAITGKRKRQPEYVPDGIDFTPGAIGDGRLRIYDAKRTKNLPCVQLDSSSPSPASYFCNPDPTVDAKLGINTRTPTHNLHVVQTNSAMPLARFTLADGTTHPLTIDELGNTTFVGSATTINGNLNVTGTTTTISSLNVTGNFITVNSDLAGGSAPTEDCGINVNRGNSTDFNMTWRESDDTFVIGLVGAQSAVATRQDAPTDGGIMVWNNALKRCDNYSNFTFTGSRLGVGTSTAFPSPLATLHIIGEGSDDPLQIYDPDFGGDFFKIDSNGIATLDQLDGGVVVSGGVSIAKRLYSNGALATLGNLSFEGYGGNAQVISTTNTNGSLCLVTNGTGRVAITCGGSALSSTPGALLHVQYSGSESGIDCFRVDDAASTDSSYFHVDQDGRVGINCGVVQGIYNPPVMQVTGLLSNTGPECLAKFTGSDNVGPGGINIERVSGGSWTTTGAMITAGFHYGASDNTIVYDNTFSTSQLGQAIHFDTTNSVMKFLTASTASNATPSVFPELAMNTYSRLQLEFLSTTRGVYVATTFNALSSTSTSLCVNGTFAVTGDIIMASGNLSHMRVQAATASTSTTTGAAIVAGGVGVGGNVNLGRHLYAVDTAATSTFAGLVFTGTSGYIRITPVIVAATTYTMLATDEIVLMTNTATRTITLQACATAGVGRIVRFHEAGGTTNAVTINTVNSEVINGGGVASSTTRSIITAYGYISFLTNGTAWYVLSTG
jgi:hypothetical protein